VEEWKQTEEQEMRFAPSHNKFQTVRNIHFIQQTLNLNTRTALEEKGEGGLVYSYMLSDP
jgi:hypothetical protein